jgi:HTH-type transcriptional regulator / antitoxin HigA
MSTTAIRNDFKRMPRTYAGLVAMFPPRPIHDEADYDNAVEVIERLAGHRLNADQEDYLEALATFVEAWERASLESRPEVAPLDALRFLMSEHGMNASDLGRLLGSRTLGGAILSGKRSLSKANIRKLAEHFKVEPGLFL